MLPRGTKLLVVVTFALGACTAPKETEAPTSIASVPGTVQPSLVPVLTTGTAPPHGAVVFDETSDRTHSELAFMVPGTTASPILMTDAGNERRVARDAAWSPDGTHVAFVLGRRDSWRYTGDGDLYVMDADGSGLHRITHGIGVTSPTWSPDGTHLAFVRNQGTALCVIKADGSNLRVIASARGYYQHPRWSPLGNVIVYQSHIHGSDWGGTFAIRPDGTDERRMPVFMGEGSYPSWSPDGRKLVFAGGNGLAVFDITTGQTRRLSVCSRCAGGMFPAWSPDGSAIAFIRQEDGGASFHLYVVDLHSGTVVRLGSHVADQGTPSWRP